MTNRRGTSLVEMMIVLAVLGVVAAIATNVLGTLFRASAQWQADSASGHALDQLELSLRDNVHAAIQAEVDDNRLSLSLSNDEQVVYTALTGEVTQERIHTDNDGEQIVARDRFPLPRGRKLMWRTEEQNDIDWLYVELPPLAADSTSSARSPLRLEIRVGRHTTPARSVQP